MKSLKSSMDRQTVLIESIIRNMDIKTDFDDFEDKSHQERRQSIIFNRTNTNSRLRNVIFKQLMSNTIDEENEI
jgi:hypothetical protein